MYADMFTRNALRTRAWSKAICVSQNNMYVGLNVCVYLYVYVCVSLCMSLLFLQTHPPRGPSVLSMTTQLCSWQLGHTLTHTDSLVFCVLCALQSVLTKQYK